MAETFPITLASVVAALLYFAFAALSKWRRMQGAKEPPGPKGWPLIGNAPELARSQGHLIPIFTKWGNQYGSIAQFSILGEKQVVISSEKIANDLFIKRGTKYSGRGVPYAISIVTKNLNPALMPKTDGWRRERKLIHSAMSITVNEKYQGFMADESVITLHDLIKDPSAFERHFTRYSYGVLTRSLLGFSIESADHPFRLGNEKIMAEALKCFRPDVYPSNVFPFLRSLPAWLVPSNGEIKRLREGLADDWRSLRADVEASVEDGTAKNSVYKHFIQNRDEYPVSDEEAGYTFQSMIGGGVQSPFNALMTFVYLMMEYPEWQEKLHQQIDEVVGPGRLPTFSDIPNLPLVRAIVKEGIRYRSIHAELGIPHRLDEDDVYDGYFFAAGTVFHTNFAAILMDKNMYPDQQDFNPARWIDPKYPTYKEPLTVHPNCQNFAPFGYGRRACPGYDFAERTLNIMVARMGWACNIKKPIDRTTNKPVVITMKYEPTPNPKPFPFPCDIQTRSLEKNTLVSQEVVAIVR